VYDLWKPTTARLRDARVLTTARACVPALIDRACMMIDEIPWYDRDDAAL